MIKGPVNGRPVGKNYCFVTAMAPKVYTEQRQIEHDWNAGAEFKLYRHPGSVTKNDTFKLQVAGFTHVMVVWQDEREGNSVMGCEILLAYGQ